jgi:hypothetical protein
MILSQFYFNYIPAFVYSAQVLLWSYCPAYSFRFHFLLMPNCCFHASCICFECWSCCVVHFAAAGLISSRFQVICVKFRLSCCGCPNKHISCFSFSWTCFVFCVCLCVHVFDVFRVGFLCFALGFQFSDVFSATFVSFHRSLLYRSHFIVKVSFHSCFCFCILVFSFEFEDHG